MDLKSKHTCPSQHTNGFIDMNGVPYLLGEYIDRNKFMQIDRSLIQSEIVVDQVDAARATVRISIDGLGKISDGSPNVMGNQTKYNQLIKMIRQYSHRHHRNLEVLRPGIVVEINYQVENQRSGEPIRTMSEKIRIDKRNIFIDINSKDINDNAVVVNFMKMVASTINQFTHGPHPMIFRITSIQLYYECLRKDGSRKNHDITSMWAPYPDHLLPDYDDDFNIYDHHKQHQPHHIMDIHGRDDQSIYPDDWASFNRYYHFDNRGQDIVLHQNEIDDSEKRSFYIPCGTINVNRAFSINPGHMIIFKISIWRNDLTITSNTSMIARTLGVFGNEVEVEFHEEYDKISSALREIKQENEKQSRMFGKLFREINNMKSRLDLLENPTSTEEPAVSNPITITDPEDNNTKDEQTTIEE